MKRTEVLSRLGQLAEDGACGVHLSALLWLATDAAAAESPWQAVGYRMMDLHVLAAAVLLARLVHALWKGRNRRLAAAPVASVKGQPSLGKKRTPRRGNKRSARRR